MKQVIDQLTRQHKELVRAAGVLFGFLDADRAKSAAREAHRALTGLSGMLQVHLAMEDESFYPRLLNHREAQVRELASTWLNEREQLRVEFQRFRERFASAGAIEADAPGFVDEGRRMLGMLWNRMNDEDKQLHPDILAAVNE